MKISDITKPPLVPIDGTGGLHVRSDLAFDDIAEFNKHAQAMAKAGNDPKNKAVVAGAVWLFKNAVRDGNGDPIEDVHTVEDVQRIPVKTVLAVYRAAAAAISPKLDEGND